MIATSYRSLVFYWDAIKELSNTTFRLILSVTVEQAVVVNSETGGKTLKIHDASYRLFKNFSVQILLIQKYADLKIKESRFGTFTNIRRYGVDIILILN